MGKMSLFGNLLALLLSVSLGPGLQTVIIAVAITQTRNRRWSPRWIAASASTIVSELMRSTNELTDVNGMSKIS